MFSPNIKIGEDLCHEGDLSDLYIRLEALHCLAFYNFYAIFKGFSFSILRDPS